MHVRKLFPQLESKDPYHGGHGFHPYGQHDWPRFMVDVLAQVRDLTGMNRLSYTYLPTYLVPTLEVGRYLGISYMSRYIFGRNSGFPSFCFCAGERTT